MAQRFGVHGIADPDGVVEAIFTQSRLGLVLRPEAVLVLGPLQVVKPGPGDASATGSSNLLPRRPGRERFAELGTLAPPGYDRPERQLLQTLPLRQRPASLDDGQLFEAPGRRGRHVAGRRGLVRDHWQPGQIVLAHRVPRQVPVAIFCGPRWVCCSSSIGGVLAMVGS
jgi:hypothetical protein